MATLSSIYIKKETLQTLLNVLNAKQWNDGKGVSITISQNDESDKYGQNVASWVSQTKEQREAKKERFFVGNGKVFWSKGETPIWVKVEEAATSQPAYTNNNAPEQGDEPPF